MKAIGSTKWELDQQCCSERRKKKERKAKGGGWRLYGRQHDELSPAAFGGIVTFRGEKWCDKGEKE